MVIKINIFGINTVEDVGGAWRAMVHSVAQSWTQLKRLSTALSMKGNKNTERPQKGL